MEPGHKIATFLDGDVLLVMGFNRAVQEGHGTRTWYPTGNNNITRRVLGLDDGRHLNASNWGPNIILAPRHRRCEGEGVFVMSTS